MTSIIAIYASRQTENVQKKYDFYDRFNTTFDREVVVKKS